MILTIGVYEGTDTDEPDAPDGTVTLTKTRPTGPQDDGLESFREPRMWGAVRAILLSLTVPSGGLISTCDIDFRSSLEFLPRPGLQHGRQPDDADELPVVSHNRADLAGRAKRSH